jgi:hypothetical protein
MGSKDRDDAGQVRKVIREPRPRNQRPSRLERCNIAGDRQFSSMRITGILAAAAPVVLAALPLGHEPARPVELPAAHAVDVWLGHTESVGIDPAMARAARQPPLLGLETAPQKRIAAAGLAAGFQVVGSVAVLEGDEATTTRSGTRRGIDPGMNLPAVSARFIEAFGDNYDQIAVYLAFTDYASTQSLAYQMPVKNDVSGIGLPIFDGTTTYGSRGRLSTMLNMKRILVYGRDSAEDPENDLYSVWAQEAAHRWLTYLKFQREGEDMPNASLLGRQGAHWARGVQADASIMDGYLWRDNLDGTFTPVDRNKRYGALDQYGMGLLLAKDVPPFFLLENLRQEQDDVSVDKVGVARGGRYKATKVDLTIKDIQRALGPREPATDIAAQDMRMGVVLLTAPGVPADQVIGESYRIDRTRRLWDDFYNAAGGGRGKVCTNLLRPCRGVSLSYGAATASEAGGDQILAPGETFSLKVPVTNEGTVRGGMRVKADARGALALTRDTVDLPALGPGEKGMLTFEGRVPLGTPCGAELPVDFTTVESGARVNPSKGTATVVIGMASGPLETFETDTGWTVNPEGKDTAKAGGWELGAPERSEAFEFVMQPGAAFSGKMAFVTGASLRAGVSDNDVRLGVTSVQSTPFALAGLRDPHLSYEVYFVAADFVSEVLVPGEGDSLRVLASPDGATWTEVDRVTGMATGWRRRLIKLAAKLPAEALAAPSLKLRFVAEDAAIENVVEAVIDDVGILGAAPTCGLPAPDGGAGDAGGGGPGPGCECAFGHRGGRSSAALVLVLLIIGVGRRARWPGRSS